MLWCCWYIIHNFKWKYLKWDIAAVFYRRAMKMILRICLSLKEARATVYQAAHINGRWMWWAYNFQGFCNMWVVCALRSNFIKTPSLCHLAGPLYCKCMQIQIKEILSVLLLLGRQNLKSQVLLLLQSCAYVLLLSAMSIYNYL